MRKTLFLLFGFIFIACQADQKHLSHITISPIEVNSLQSGEPNLYATKNGVYLSWVEFLSDSTDALQFSKMAHQNWSTPQEIARGNNWFVNWADFPSLSVNGDWLAAHWLQKSAAGTYDYDVRISQSLNAGKSWQASFIPHRDSIAAEHGFASLLPFDNDHFFAVWLDGRNSAQADSKSKNHGHGGAMTLRTALFDQSGHLSEEAELDQRICDCCQTAAAMTSQGPIVAYRDRSEHEIRDISIVRKKDGQWTKPHTIHADNWEITGCPVNGPALAANGHQVAVAWFTAAHQQPKVQIAFSSNAGATFSNPIQIDHGTPAGRVDIAWKDTSSVLVSWLENEADSAGIWLKQIHLNGQTLKKTRVVTSSPARSSGFPILAPYKEDWIIAWTAVGDSTTQVRTVIIQGL